MAGPPDEFLEQLSPASREVLRWAGVAARAWQERNGLSPSLAEIDEFDLLVGVMLADPEGSEPRALVEHVGATAADLLPPNYPLPAPELLARHANAADAVELSREVRALLRDAPSWRGTTVSGPVEPREIYGSLQRWRRSGVAVAVRALLDKAGLTAVVESYDDYLRQSESSDASQSQSAPRDSQTYADFLKQRHPYRPAPVEIPTYKPDHGPGAMGQDFVDIQAEVDSFAYLLASRALQPPLAVGLFGDWGSGKSFFMDALRSRIEQLTHSGAVVNQRQADVPFWKRIVQIEFNAWHYLEGDLWASLVEHVFSQLQVRDDEDPTEVAKRQRHWLEKIDTRLQETDALKVAKEAKAAALAAAQTGLAEARQRREAEQAKLAKAEKEAADKALFHASRKQLKKALAGLVDTQLDGEVGKALAAIDDARAELRRGSGIIRGFRLTDPRTWFAVVVLALVPVLVWWLGQADLSGSAQVFGGISALLAAGTAALRSATSQVASRLTELDKAAAEVRAMADKKRQTLDRSVAEAQAKLDEAQAEIDHLAAQEAALAQEIGELNAQVAGITATGLLSEFVTERFGSTDYRTRLGTAALVQRDFRALSKLIDEQNIACLAADDDDGTVKTETLNRIILYIDDLDRCDAKRVVKVLQAVHLLLAFPLFVVVVAVDSRWLAQSLKEHYPALATADQATPSDYLEKIFQVPFWVQPLGRDARGSMVRGLLQGSLVDTSTGDDPGEGQEAGQRLEVGDQERRLLEEMFSHRTAIRMQTAALTVTAKELTFLDGLGPLLGETPRSIKRFVNVYQLLCGLPPVPLPPNVPPYEELVAFLLAITDGMPGLLASLRNELATAGPRKMLAGAITTAKTTLSATDAARYDTWIADHEGWDKFPLVHLAVPAERVRRFSFR